MRRLLLAGIPLVGAIISVGSTQTPAVKNDLTYNKHVSPIIAAKCAGCHFEGGPAPFKLLSYKDVKKHGGLVETMAILQKMPPMEGSSAFGKVPLYEKLTSTEVQIISEWLAGGMPEGTGNPAPMPEPKIGWPLGEPDFVLRNPEPIIVPAQGGTWKKVIRLPISDELAKDLTAFDLRANEPWVTRQAILAVEEPGKANTFTATGLKADQLVGIWALGFPAWQLPSDSGVQLVKGKTLAIQMLYHPSGAEADGGFQIGLYFGKKPVTRRPYWVTLGSKDFEVTGDPRWSIVESQLKLERAAEVISVQPEARELGNQMWLNERSNEAIPEGRDVLHIYRWDPRWSGAYNLINRPLLPANTILTAGFEYDNTTHADTGLTLNEANRLPPRDPVYFGPGAKDELCWVHVQLLPVKND